MGILEISKDQSEARVQMRGNVTKWVPTPPDDHTLMRNYHQYMALHGRPIVTHERESDWKQTYESFDGETVKVTEVPINADGSAIEVDDDEAVSTIQIPVVQQKIVVRKKRKMKGKKRKRMGKQIKSMSSKPKVTTSKMSRKRKTPMLNQCDSDESDSDEDEMWSRAAPPRKSRRLEVQRHNICQGCKQHKSLCTHQTSAC